MVHTEKQKFANYSARYLIEEQRLFAARAAQQFGTLIASVGLAPKLLDDDAEGAPLAKKPKMKSPYDLYVQDQLAEASVRGESRQDLLFTGAGRQQLWKGWMDLPDKDREHFELEAAFQEKAKDSGVAKPAPAAEAIADERLSTCGTSRGTFAVWADPGGDGVRAGGKGSDS